MYLGKHQIQILEKDSQAKSWSGWFAKSPSKGPLATWICMMWLPKLGFARTWAQGVLGWQFDDPIDTSCTSDAMLWWFSFRIPSWFIRGDHGWDVRLSECCNLAKKRPRKGSRKHLQTFTTKKRFRNDQNIYIYQEVVVSFFPFLPKHPSDFDVFGACRSMIRIWNSCTPRIQVDTIITLSILVQELSL